MGIINATIVKDKPNIRSIDQTDALVNDQGFTYNEAGKSYNEAGMTYGGLYGGDGRKPNNATTINL